MAVHVVAVIGTLLLIAVPTNSSATFNGAPFSSTSELIVFAVILYLFVSTPIRQEIRGNLQRCSHRHKTFFVLALTLAAALKCFVYLSAPTTGQFEVCYRHFNARSGVECALTFEPHPVISSHSQRFLQRSTDIPIIDFGPRTEDNQGLSRSNWRLPFVNSEEFDRGFWPWEQSQKSIETFPFWAEFRGVVKIDQAEKIRVSYRGQGSMFLDSKRVSLPASYVNRSVVVVSPASAEFELKIDFAYLYTSRNSEERSPPYAELVVERLTGKEASVLQAGSSALVRTANGVTDVSVVVLVVYFAWLARRNAIHIAVAFAMAVGCWVALFFDIRVGFGALKIEAPVIYLSICLLLLRQSRNAALLLTPSFAATGLGMTAREIKSAVGVWPQLSDVIIRLRGNDQLVYHALTRDMLENGFFRGGEDVFYFQPGIRYIFYFQQLVFGESGIVTGAVSVIMIGLGILFLARQFGWSGPASIQLLYAFSLLTLMLWWSSSHTVQTATFGLSEFGAWIILLFLFGLTLTALSDRRLMLIGVASSLVIWIRPNQGLAVLFLLGLVMAVAVRRGARVSYAITVVGLPFFVSLLLLPLHNLVFGGRLQFLPGGHANADQLGWDTLIRLASDSEARSFVLAQIRGLLYLPSVSPETFSIRLGILIVCISITCLLTVLFTRRRQSDDRWITVLQLLVVIGQLVPFVNFTLYRYFPVHNIAIYLTLLLICMQRLSFAIETEMASEKSSKAPFSHKNH